MQRLQSIPPVEGACSRVRCSSAMCMVEGLHLATIRWPFPRKGMVGGLCRSLGEAFFVGWLQLSPSSSPCCWNTRAKLWCTLRSNTCSKLTIALGCGSDERSWGGVVCSREFLPWPRQQQRSVQACSIKSARASRVDTAPYVWTQISKSRCWSTPPKKSLNVGLDLLLMK